MANSQDSRKDGERPDKNSGQDKPQQQQPERPTTEQNVPLSFGEIVPPGANSWREKLQIQRQSQDREANQSLDMSKPLAGLYGRYGSETGRVLGKGLTREFEKLREQQQQHQQQHQQHLEQQSSALPQGLNREKKETVSREFVWTPIAGFDKPSEASIAAAIGLRAFVQPKKSEFKPTEEVKAPLKVEMTLAEKFLSENSFKEQDDRPLTAAEKNEVAGARKAIAEATDPQDQLSNAIHLARLLEQLRYIEEAKKATQFALGIDPENKLAKQLYTELERVHPVDLGISSVHTSSSSVSSLSKAALRKRIVNLSQGRVAVIGDLLIDELLEGKPERISREAPVLILEHVDTQHIPGGAANTAHNIVALGAKCHAIGICGQDDYAAKLAAMLDRHGITHSLVADPDRPTTVKTRILSKAHSLRQQLLRLDRISHEPISPKIEAQLVEKVTQSAASYQAVILSDYRAGVISEGVIRACRRMALKQNLMVVVDAQDCFDRFQDCALITPNQPDTEKALGYSLSTPELLQKAGQYLLERTGVKSILITRGGDGMVLFQQGQPMAELPAFNRSDVFDVTGAGDTVVATMTLALVTGASPVEAMALGNLAAGIVVKKSGTAVTSQKELLDGLEQLSHFR